MSERDWTALRTRARGRLVQREQPEFREVLAGLLWNRRQPTRIPAAVLRVADAEDAAVAVAWAADNDVRVALRSGGHSWCGAPFREDALLLDLGGLNSCELDLESGQAWVGPALTNGALEEVLADTPWAFPIGHCSSVALGGYLLSGGFGWNAGVWGPACWRIEEFEMIDAQGAQRSIAPAEHEGLLWAARGAGVGFFGVVTRFRLRLAPRPARIRFARLEFDRSQRERLAAFLASRAAHKPASIELAIVSRPVGDPFELHGLAMLYEDGAEGSSEAESWLEELIRVATRSGELHRTTFRGLLAQLDAYFPSGHRYGVDVFNTHSSLDDLLPELDRLLERAPSPGSLGMIVPIAPPAADSTPPPASALGPEATAFVGVYGCWDDAKEDDANLEWLDHAREALTPASAGHYVGEADLWAARGRARRCFDSTAWKQLAALRDEHDPEGRFHGFPD